MGTSNPETAVDHQYSMSQATVRSKRKDRKISSDDDIQEEKRQKSKSGKSAYDLRIGAMIRQFYNEEFDAGDMQVDGNMRELMLRFGAEVFKHLSSSETERLVSGLASEMRAGFKSITDGLATGGSLKTTENKKPEVVNLAMTYAAAASKEEPNSQDAKKMEKAIEKAADIGCYSVVHPSNYAESTKEQANEWITVISERQKKLNVRLNRVRTTNRNNVSIYFKDSREQAKFMDSLEDDPIRGAEIRSSAARKVSFALRGVPAEYDVQRLEQDLIKYNGESHEYFKQEMLMVKDSRKATAGTKDDRRTKTFRIMTTMKNARLLLDDPNLYVSMRRFKVSLWKTNERCNKCLDKGHKGDDCTGRLVCKHCSGNHLSYNCERGSDAGARKCAVCFKLKKDSSHRADVDSCPTLQSEALESVNKTIAEIMAHHG